MDEKATGLVVSHGLFGTGLKGLLKKECGRVHVLGRCEDALAIGDCGGPVRIAVVDTNVLPTGGSSYAQDLRRCFPLAAILIASDPSGASEVLNYLSGGAHGVIFKTQTAREIAAAIGAVMSGGISIPPVRAQAPIAINFAYRGGARLSARQSLVLRMLAQGMSNKAIARELGLSEATVKVHVNAVFKALNVRNRASAVASMLSAGFGLGRGGTPDDAHLCVG